MAEKERCAKKKKRLIALVVIGIIVGLWFGESAIIPRVIAKISGKNYMQEHFPEMKLQCLDVEWADVYGSYLIRFRDPSDSTYYSCVMGPKYFPVSIGQGLIAIENDYVEKYK